MTINKITLILQHRPLCTMRSQNPFDKIVQLEDGRWKAGNCKPLKMAVSDRITIEDSIRMLNKNSSFRYNILVAMDSDVYPNSNFLSEFDNVRIMKSKFVLPEEQKISTTNVQDFFKERLKYDGKIGPAHIGTLRINHALYDAIHSLPDDEWIGYMFLDDCLYPKDWDVGIINSIDNMGEDYVYVPYMVETGPYPAHAAMLEDMGELTFQNIWDKWRKLGCYELMYPPPKRGYIIYKDLEVFVNIAKRENIIEVCGLRTYGFFANMFMKNKYAKKAMPIMGQNFDIFFDNNLGCGPGGLKLNKVCVGSSFVFHPSMEYREE